MELDKLKNIIKEQNDRIKENELLNKKMLKTILSSNSKNGLKKLIRYILFNLSGCFVAIIILLRFIFNGTIAEPILIVLSVVFFLATLFYIVSGVQAYRIINQIDYADSTILQIQRYIVKVKKIIVFEKKTGFLIGPLLILCGLPIGVKIIYGYSLFDFPIEYILRAVITIIASYPLVIWVYKKFYTKPIKEIEYYLKEIESIE